MKRVRSTWPLLTAAGFVVTLLAVDVVLRRPTLAVWTRVELHQYALSVLASVAFWWGLVSLASLEVRRGRALLTALGMCLGVTALFLPAAYFVVYRRFPNEDAFVFFANEWRFVFRTAASGATAVSTLLALGCAGAVAALFFMARQVRPSRTFAVAGLLALAVDVVVISVSTFAEALPLTADQVSLRLLTRLGAWRGQPPPFFQLYQRAMPPTPPPAVPRFNVLWVVHETVGARYLQTPDGREVTPNLLSLKRDDAVVWLPRLHTVSSCTDVSVPAVLSGVSSVAPLEKQLSATLAFDLARRAGAMTFVTASQRLDWGGIDRYLGGPFDRVLGAEHVDPSCEDLGVDDEVAYTAALAAMDDAAKQGRPFVGLVRSNSTHGPYRTDPADSPWQRDPGFGVGTTGGFVTYLNAMHLMDARFGAFWDALRERPWFDDTLVIITADHGEAFQQHGTLWHCGDFSPEESWVPGALRLPRALRHGPVLERLRTRGETVLPTTDLFPTVAELLGWSDLLAHQFDGQSLLHGDEPRAFSFTNCSDLRRCPVADFGAFDGRRRWLYSSTTRRWRSWDELADPLALHELPEDPQALAALKLRIEHSTDADLARRIIGW